MERDVDSSARTTIPTLDKKALDSTERSWIVGDHGSSWVPRLQRLLLGLPLHMRWDAAADARVGA